MDTFFGATRWCSWLRNCATNRKVAGSIGNFHLLNPSGQHYNTGVDSASEGNEYQEYLLKV
jgi:hypothetical protein